jgi:uncharacterized membrane protein YidH (DUF202 family)
MIIRQLIVIGVTAAGFGILKLAFGLLCWTVGHNYFEMVWGGWAIFVLTCAIGVEAIAFSRRADR